MRISITYLYVIFQYGYPHTVKDVLAALPKIRKLGFRFLEMEGLGPQVAGAGGFQRFHVDVQQRHASAFT